MVKKYKQVAIDNNFNTYFLCVGDKDYNIEKEDKEEWEEENREFIDE